MTRRSRQPYASARLFSPAELRALLRRYGRVRMTAVRAGADGRSYGAGGAMIDWIRLRLDRSTAPFLVAAVWL
ncbi:MAG: hypothetical protein BWZ02_00182 [Lentisphaerae bacterium ADurb.BinA184]|nr:MAG: hypothetical protein BWZ02_00182 [Lentisphaerae bacterium ADurb.BinA184]